MASSRRSPLMRPEWRDEDADQRGYRDRKPRDRRRHLSPSPTRRPASSRGDLGSRTYDRPNVLDSASYERRQDHHRGPPVSTVERAHHSSHHTSSKHRGEEPRKPKPFDEERPRKRYRHHERSPPPRQTHSRSVSLARRHYIEDARRRDHSPRPRHRDVSPAPRSKYYRELSPHPPRKSYQKSSNENRHTHSDWSVKGSYPASPRRGRSSSRSPATPDHRRSDIPSRTPESPHNHHHHHRNREYKGQTHQKDPRGSPGRDREPSPARSKGDQPRSYPSEKGPTKSSKRSEKQKQRTLRHLRAKHKANEFLRRLSVSPSLEDNRDPDMPEATRPIQSILDEPSRKPSPPRPIPSFDASGHSQLHLRDQYPMHGMKANDMHQNHRRVPPHIDTRQQPYATSPQYMTPTSSHHGSPHSASPYSQGRGWGGQPQHYMSQHGQSMNAYSPSYRQSSYPPPNGPHHQYHGSPQYQGNQHAHHGYHSPSYRGGHPGARGNNHAYSPPHDRRFSGGSGPHGGHANHQSSRGRGGHFQNLQWTANTGGRGGKHGDGPGGSHHPHIQSQSPTTQQSHFPNSKDVPVEEENPFRPSKDFRVEDTESNDVEMVDSSKEHPSQPQEQFQDSAQHSKEASKFSFAFKAKPAPAPAAKPPVPDLTQKMKDPPHPKRDNSKPDQTYQGKQRPIVPTRELLPPKSRREHRPEYWNDRRDERREKEYHNRYRDDRRNNRDDRRPDSHSERRSDRGEPRPDRRPERDLGRPDKIREREKSPETIKVKKMVKRVKPRPTLPADFAASDSVYYRKPGNESVIGSGTYGKVFKAIHVYTKNLVALKKIRMEGEKDGFPVTAVREIKLLQSLKHENVVGLYEVMVEKNDCFMVFEYLSHDLTGLLNHPTFRLEHSHKKHLAKQLFEGLDYLHRRGVLHRDIKAANILVSNTGQLKLADFGLARFYAKRRQLDYTNRVITIWYRPPELLLGETQYGPAVDIWSAACVMVEISTKHAIFPGDGGEISQLERLYDVLGTPTRSEWPGLVDMAWFELLRPTERKPNRFAEKYKERLTPAAFELLQAMLLYDPAKRPSAGDVLEHPYFTTEEPAPAQALGLKDLEGDWHEFESKALRRENERRDKEARRAQRQEDHEREKAKRRASDSVVGGDRDAKRPRPSTGQEVEMSEMS